MSRDDVTRRPSLAQLQCTFNKKKERKTLIQGEMARFCGYLQKIYILLFIFLCHVNENKVPESTAAVRRLVNDPRDDGSSFGVKVKAFDAGLVEPSVQVRMWESWVD